MTLMVNVIRHPEEFEPPVMGSVAKFWLFVSCLLALGLCIAAFFYYRLYGAIGGGVVGAVAFLAIVTVVWMLRRSQVDDDSAVEASTPEAISLLVNQSIYPCLYLRNGRPVLANGHYFDFAAKMGAGSITNTPPSIDILFRAAGDDTKATIFRLLHEAPDSVAAEADIAPVFDGDIRNFRLRVTTQPGCQFWDIIDLDARADYASKRLAEAPIGLASVDQDGRVLHMNSNLLRWLGLTESDRPNYLREFIDDPELLLDSPLSAGRLVRADTRLVTHTGVLTPVVMQATWQAVDSDRYVAYVALHGHSSLRSGPRSNLNSNSAPTDKPNLVSGQTGQDVKDFVTSPIAFIELDSVNMADAKITSTNLAFDRLVDNKAVTGENFTSLFRPVTLGIDFSKLDARERNPDEPFDAVLMAGSDKAVSMYIVADVLRENCQVYMVDISARKALEDQLVQSQKMQAIGRLVAEIAHDFNNLLAAMRLYTDTLIGRHPIGDPSYPELQQINANVNRAASLVKKLLAYSRKQTVRPVRLDVSETLSDIAVTLKQVLGEKVRLTVKHGRDLPKVRVDRSQLDTVLMNLSVNARDAMKEQGGGDITIESETTILSDVSDQVLKASLASLNSDRFSRISVSDTGTGITDEIKSKIFEPFFTTKAQGEGTGLGLSTVYGIIEQAGGHLAVESELGVGTTFSIYLPEALQDTESDEAVDTTPSQTRRPPSDLAGQGNILFVEDEDSVRVIAAKTLRKRGYNVVEAANGEEAFELIEEADVPFDLMISDVVMPGMDGPTLLKKARDMLGEARIVFISGYAEEEFSELLAEEPDVTFLPKPFTLVQLAEKVKTEIGEVDP